MFLSAGMAELADAADLKSAGLKKLVGVRVPLSAPVLKNIPSVARNPYGYDGLVGKYSSGSFDSAALRSGFRPSTSLRTGSAGSLPRGGITPAKRLKKRSLDCARDFASRLGRRENGST